MNSSKCNRIKLITWISHVVVVVAENYYINAAFEFINYVDILEFVDEHTNNNEENRIRPRERIIKEEHCTWSVRKDSYKTTFGGSRWVRTASKKDTWKFWTTIVFGVVDRSKTENATSTFYTGARWATLNLLATDNNEPQNVSLNSVYLFTPPVGLW